MNPNINKIVLFRRCLKINIFKIVAFTIEKSKKIPKINQIHHNLHIKGVSIRARQCFFNKKKTNKKCDHQIFPLDAQLLIC